MVEKQKQKRSVFRKQCPKCSNTKMFSSRGETNPSYIFKCTKCGYQR